MSKLEHRNHILYSLLAPRLLSILSEDLEVYGRIGFSKCRLSPDGSFLDIFIQKAPPTKEIIKRLTDYVPELQKMLAEKKVLSRMPKIRLRAEVGVQNTHSIEDILDDNRAKYDLS